MIDISGNIDLPPYYFFYDFYKKAKSLGQNPINAISISSYNKENEEVESRFVNLKYIIGEKWTFFSNYESMKAKSFTHHNQIAALIYWEKLDLQIRIKAKIEKSPAEFSDMHFNKRALEKNALAISSRQSLKIKSYEEVIANYENILNDKDALRKRPSYWGGYTFTPYYFEFWFGHESRLNKRDSYQIKNGECQHSILQP
mgnify:FL=1